MILRGNMEQLGFNFDQPAGNEFKEPSRFVNESYTDEIDEAIAYMKKQIPFYDSLSEKIRKDLVKHHLEQNNNVKVSEKKDLPKLAPIGFFATEEDIDDAVAWLKEQFDCWDRFPRAKQEKLLTIVLTSRRKVEESRQWKQEHKGQKVKRVPYAPPGIDEIAHLIGEDKLASELNVKRPKPVIGGTVKEGNITKIYRSNLEPKPIHRPLERLSDEDKRNVLKVYLDSLGESINDKSPISIIENLERLVGELTTKKFVLERKIMFARKALASAMEKLEEMNFEEILKEEIKKEDALLKKNLDIRLRQDLEIALNNPETEAELGLWDLEEHKENLELLNSIKQNKKSAKNKNEEWNKECQQASEHFGYNFNKQKNFVLNVVENFVLNIIDRKLKPNQITKVNSNEAKLFVKALIEAKVLVDRNCHITEYFILSPKNKEKLFKDSKRGINSNISEDEYIWGAKIIFSSFVKEDEVYAVNGNYFNNPDECIGKTIIVNEKEETILDKMRNAISATEKETGCEKIKPQWELTNLQWKKTYNHFNDILNRIDSSILNRIGSSEKLNELADGLIKGEDETKLLEKLQGSSYKERLKEIADKPILCEQLLTLAEIIKKEFSTLPVETPKVEEENITYGTD